jgi:hypothetical protein
MHSQEHSNVNDAEEIKARVSLYEAGAILFPGHNLKRNPCNSPFREDHNESFSVYENGRKWNDFATSDGGDLFEFVGKAIGGDFKAAKQWVIDHFGVSYASDTQRAEPEKRKKEPRALTQEERKLCGIAAEKLAKSPEEVARWRGWNPDTIRHLALDGCLGIWSGNEPEGWDSKLVFMENSTVKSRYLTTVKGERGFRFLEGTSPGIWRGELVSDVHERVFLAKGQTDAITLLDCGIEDDGRTIGR